MKNLDRKRLDSILAQKTETVKWETISLIEDERESERVNLVEDDNDNDKEENSQIYKRDNYNDKEENSQIHKRHNYNDKEENSQIHKRHNYNDKEETSQIHQRHNYNDKEENSQIHQRHNEEIQSQMLEEINIPDDCLVMFSDNNCNTSLNNNQQENFQVKAENPNFISKSQVVNSTGGDNNNFKMTIDNSNSNSLNKNKKIIKRLFKKAEAVTLKKETQTSKTIINKTIVNINKTENNTNYNVNAIIPEKSFNKSTEAKKSLNIKIPNLNRNCLPQDKSNNNINSTLPSKSIQANTTYILRKEFAKKLSCNRPLTINECVELIIQDLSAVLDNVSNTKKKMYLVYQDKFYSQYNICDAVTEEDLRRILKEKAEIFLMPIEIFNHKSTTTTKKEKEKTDGTQKETIPIQNQIPKKKTEIDLKSLNQIASKNLNNGTNSERWDDITEISQMTNKEDEAKAKLRLYELQEIKNRNYFTKSKSLKLIKF